MREKIILGIIILVVLILLIYKKQSSDRKTKTITINGHPLIVEVADTDNLRSQGLSGRTSLAKDTGMLFMFPTSSYYRFWMKDMRFPLDFIWLDKDTVVDISENVQVPKSKAEELTTFTAREPFDNVLEVNAGIAKSLNIVIRDVIH